MIETDFDHLRNKINATKFLKNLRYIQQNSQVTNEAGDVMMTKNHIDSFLSNLKLTKNNTFQ